MEIVFTILAILKIILKIFLVIVLIVIILSVIVFLTRDTTPIPNNQAYEDSQARYFKWYRPHIFKDLPFLYRNECTSEEAMVNKRFLKAWFNEDGKMIRFETYKKMERINVMEYQYNDRGQLVKMIDFDESGATKESRNIYLLAHFAQDFKYLFLFGWVSK